jgi:ethanolamine utilization protein EutQ (cupin superfamily)
MSLPFSVNGARTVIPGVYDYLRVQDSLPSPVPGPRSIVLIGEAQSGVPSKFLDLRLNYFTDYNSLLAYYKKGPLVDAARQIFANQPSPAFTGAVSRLYVYKTNNTTRAEKVIASPSNFGSLVAAVWEEDGNLIKSQIKLATSEVKPSKSFQYILSGSARTLNAVVSGKKFTSGSLSALALPSAVQSALSSALSGVASVSGGALRSLFSGSDTADLAVSAVGDELTIALSQDSSTSSFATAQAGDVLVIPHASSIKGASSENAGVYVVLSSSLSAISAKKLHSLSAVGADIDYVAPGAATGTNIVVADQSAYATAEMLVFSPITITVTESTIAGSAASLELLDSGAGSSGLRGMVEYSAFAEVLNESAATIGFISATASGSSLAVAISGATFSTVAKPGDVVQIGHSSAIAGASQENVGLYVVASANASALSLVSLVGSTLASVASVTLGGVTSHLLLQPGFVTSSYGARKIASASESQVLVEASRQKDNAVWPSAAIGGKSFMEISYNDGVATAASLSIDQTRKMTIAFVGGPASVVIPTLKYETLNGLVSYINSLPGFSARVVDNKDSSLSVKVLDMVSSVGILAGSSAAQAQNGRLKGDYYLWSKHFQDNTSNLLAFKEGTAPLKVGLPAVEAAAGFLSGAAIGGTSGAEVQAALDSALKIDVSQVLPLFSRDALYDIQDGYTDPSSSYTIDAIHAAVSAHCASASGSLVRKERFGLLSFHGSFEEAKAKASATAFERLQMTFQLARTINSQGAIEWMQPWALAAAVAAGRAQGALGTAMLRKSFGVSAVKHIGNLPPYSDTLSQDFEPDSNGELSEAIESGLLCFQERTGAGIQLVSPDLTTRSRESDPQGWVWERCNVLFTLDEVRKSVRGSLENFIGARTSDVSPAFVSKSISDILGGFVNQGALIGFQVVEVKSQGNAYTAKISVIPTECIESIVLEVTAQRSIENA